MFRVDILFPSSGPNLIITRHAEEIRFRNVKNFSLQHQDYNIVHEVRTARHTNLSEVVPNSRNIPRAISAVSRQP
jgi:hypothetical protein